ncbi:MAG: TetR family transcriptional regulator [Candidatus Hydrogenedentes bacterium]|nr:TetR family transcriptional regulator [Candidatus Hydrogenedentota bacterium]
MPFSDYSMALPRREREKARKNTAILDAAQRVFQRRGYRQATMEEIARESSYSVGTLYNLFRDKDDLYNQVIARIGEAVVSRVQGAVLAERDPEKAIETHIRLRLCNYFNDRLFFETFSCPPELGVQPEPGRLEAGVLACYRKYLEVAEQLLERVAGPKGEGRRDDFRMALGLEGIVTAYMGYWAGPRQSDSLTAIAHQIHTMLLRGVGSDRFRQAAAPDAAPAALREVHLSSYDLERLRELITVARDFGGAACSAYLDVLDAELNQARVVQPREVPPNLVTMNSRVRLRHADTGEERVCVLVFPKDAEVREENVSILSRLGTALLGFRVGDIIEYTSTRGTARYRIDALLYQPEAAGDYHL